MKIKVAVFDDSRERRESLQYLIQMYDDLLCVGTYDDCARIDEAFFNTAPDVVLMDIGMPEVDGIKGVKMIKSRMPNTVVLMQTVYEDDDHLFESIKSGASGYLLKKDSPDRIVAAIREAADNGAPMSPQMALKVLRFFQQDKEHQNQYALTEKEKIILSLLVEGLSYKMIAHREDISYHTVNSHVRKIYEKLHVHSMGEAVSKALREKLI